MSLLTPELRAALRVNARALDDPAHDPAPVVKLFNPLSAATWLATELAGDGDTLFGLADLGFGCPELGRFSLGELESIRLAFGLRLERDQHFAGCAPLSVWADTARHTGSILAAEITLRAARGNQLPPADPAGG